jgi:hypothetical protein
MGKAKCSDNDFINLFKEHGPHKTARILKANVQGVYARRTRLEAKLGYQIQSPDISRNTRRADAHPHRLNFKIMDGVAMVGSDLHTWPGIPISTAHRAFVHFAKKLKDLKLVVQNGDVMDFPRISRHPPIGWDEQPSVQDEIESAQERLGEVEDAVRRGVDLVWNLGNHDGRFETRLATVAPEFARVAGFSLKDHFPRWSPAWSTWINSEVVIKHRFKGGIHATHNNAIWSGKTVITGHLHSAKVTPFTDYNGTRYGVDTGCLADPDAKAFVDYTEDNPKNWRSGFVVLTFKEGKMLPPELVLVWDAEHVVFRGELIKV